MGLVLFLAIGAAVGVLANQVLKTDIDMVLAMGLGVAGAFLGWIVKQFLLALTGMIFSFVFVIGGAFLLVWAWKRFSR